MCFLFNQTGWCLDQQRVGWRWQGLVLGLQGGWTGTAMGGSFLFVSTFSVTLTVKLILKGGEGDLSEVGKINKVILCFNKPMNSSSSTPGSKLWYGRCAICNLHVCFVDVFHSWTHSQRVQMLLNPIDVIIYRLVSPSYFSTLVPNESTERNFSPPIYASVTSPPTSCAHYHIFYLKFTHFPR